MDFLTKLIHGGAAKDNYHGAASVPIFQTSTFHQGDPEHLAGFEYARSGNPTRIALEEALAELEKGSQGFAFSSGMAAISSVLLLFQPGDHVLVSSDIYGGTFRIITKLFSKWGLKASFVDFTDIAKIEKALTPDTKAIIAETPSNPLLAITDLRAVAELAQKRGIITIIDNTFMTPYLQNPLALGFDIVLHSATKFLGGHSDVLAGAAVVKEEGMAKKLKFIHNGFGAVLGAFDSWLVLRGIRTLAARMEQSQNTAAALAEWLSSHPKIKKVHYPGLKNHPGKHIHDRQASGYGAVLSFELYDKDSAVKFMKNVKIPLVAVSLGGVESILSYPATMSHAAMPREERYNRGITDELVRLSVGLEALSDLKNDLLQALEEV